MLQIDTKNVKKTKSDKFSSLQNEFNFRAISLIEGPKTFENKQTSLEVRFQSESCVLLQVLPIRRSKNLRYALRLLEYFFLQFSR